MTYSEKLKLHKKVRTTINRHPATLWRLPGDGVFEWDGDTLPGERIEALLHPVF